MKLIDLTGKTFWSWTVIKRSDHRENNQVLWECKCTCGTVRDLYGCHLRSGVSKSCGCLQSTYKMEKHPQWSGFGEISGSLYSSIKGNAGHRKGRRKNNPLAWDLDIEFLWDLFLKQDRKCALSGVELVMNYEWNKYTRRDRGEHTASLDRIDSAHGYIKGNVQWVHKDVNYMKRNYTESYFIDMCKLIANHNLTLTKTYANDSQQKT